MAGRPSPAIETIAYSCAAEMLANAIKHSSATRRAALPGRIGVTGAASGTWKRYPRLTRYPVLSRCTHDSR
ncbi:MAG: hypothetical protein ACRDNS_29800 [Trebonia sp.]